MNRAWPSLQDTAARLGLVHADKRWGPCPACQARQASRSDHRLPLRFSRAGWWCLACQTKGDAVSLVGLSLHEEGRPRGRTFVECVRWLEGTGALPAMNLPEEDPVRIDPLPALRRAVPVSEVSDPRLDAYLEQRRIPKTAPAGWLPRFSADWWGATERNPLGFSRYWPLVVPACSGRGVIESMQGLAVEEAAPRSKMWPKGAESRELLFADRKVRSWLAGSAPPPKQLLVVEGVPDYLTATCVLEDIYVIGVSAGCARALRLVTLSTSTDVYVGTHADVAGRRYEAEVVDALWPQLVRPLPLERLLA